MQFPRRNAAAHQPDRDVRSISSRANRRRLKVFLGVFVVTAAIGLAYTFVRPPEYRAVTRVVITPGTTGAKSATGSSVANPVLVEANMLTAHDLVQRVVADLQAKGEITENLGPDPAALLQSRLTVAPLADTDLVELSATGPQPKTLAPLLNGLVEAYRVSLAANFQDTASDSLDKLSEQSRIEEKKVEQGRAALEAFRLNHNIVSTERDENDVLARLKGVGTSLSQAADRVSAAEAKLRTLREMAAAGEAPMRAKDNPTIAALEQRAASLREALRDWEARFTPAYLRYDNQARAARDQLAETEKQIVAARAGGQSAAISEAEEELANARATADQLRGQADSSRRTAGVFVANFNQFKTMQQDLAQLESVHRDTQTRLMSQEASEQTRTPVIGVVEAASTPLKPFRPLYKRDAAISLGAALGLALFAMWLVELFNRPEPIVPGASNASVLQPWLPVGVDVTGRLRMANAAPGGAPPVESLAGQAAALRLAGEVNAPANEPWSIPRELSPREVTELLAATPEPLRPLLGLMLCGLTSEEVSALRWDSVDFDARTIRVPGEFSRELPLPDPLLMPLRLLRAGADSEFVADHGKGRPASADELRTAVLCAAHDGAIANPAQVTPDVLRHTFIAHLLRQGIRFSDLGRVIGQLSAEALTRYGSMAPPGQRRGVDQIDLMVPGLQGI